MQVFKINSKKMDGGDAVNGRPALRIDSGSARVCLHVLTGRVDMPKVCTRQFECYHCAFDQLLDDMETVGQPRCCTVVST